jgi:NAD(P)-dependent dehydrogenase (short-subunit alcohol dehydrogenase family)
MQKKIIVIGASGTIGKEVSKRLQEVGHEVIRVSRKSGDFQADISDKKSLETLFKNISPFDAVAITAGEVAAAAFESLTDENYSFSVGSKLMGQINTVRAALPYINENGSFTLVSGVLTDEPILGGTIGTLINGAVESFVKAASNELPKAVVSIA